MMLARPPSRVSKESTEISTDGTKITTTTTTTRNLVGTTKVKRVRKISRSKTALDNSSHHQRNSDGRSTPIRRCKTSQPSSLMMNMSFRINSKPDLLLQHSDTPSFEKAVKRCIPASFQLLASQDEVSQAQEDYFAMDHYKLPPLLQSTNRAGSVATCALLELLHEAPHKFVARTTATTLSSYNCHQVLQSLQKRIQTGSKLLNAKPTISSSRPLGPPRIHETYAPFALVPPGYTGTRRAVLIGVVSGGRSGHPLQAPPNDVAQMKHFLLTKGGFQPQNVTVLLEHTPDAKPPTRANILAAFATLIKTTCPGDVCVVQYSGHGGRGTHNLHIVPSDFAKAGPIRDEDIMKDLIKALPAHSHTTMVVDCCFSGTLGDLPYVLKSEASKQEIEIYFDTDTRQEMQQQEQIGGEAYQTWKQHRNRERLLQKLSPVKMMEDAAAAVQEAAARLSDSSAAAAARLSDAAAQATSLLRDTSMRDLSLSMRESTRNLMKSTSKKNLTKETSTRNLNKDTSSRNLMKGSSKRNLMKETSTRKLVKEPSSRKLSKEPSSRKLSKEPSSIKLSKDTSTRKLVKDTSSRKLSKEPSSRKLSKEPSSRKLSKEPSSRKLMKETSTRKLMKETSTRKLMKETSIRDLIKGASIRNLMRDTSMKDSSIKKTMKDSSMKDASTSSNSSHHGLRRSSTHSISSTASTVSNTSVGSSSPEHRATSIKRCKTMSTNRQGTFAQPRPPMPRSKTTNEGIKSTKPDSATTTKRPWWIPSTPTNASEKDMPSLAPMNTTTSSKLKQITSTSSSRTPAQRESAEDAEERARRLAVERSRAEAAEARAARAATKSRC